MKRETVDPINEIYTTRVNTFRTLFNIEWKIQCCFSVGEIDKKEN